MKGHLVDKKSQSGFVHLVIIVILVFVIAGALGFTYWHNLIGQNIEASIQESDQVAEKDVELSESVSEDITEQVATLNYPSDWTVEKRAYSSSLEDINIVSPSGDITVNLTSLIRDSRGYTCSLEGSSVIADLYEYEIKEYPGYHLYSGRISSSSNDNTYFSRVLENSEYIKVGGSACYIGISGIMTPEGDSNSLMININSFHGVDNLSVDQINDVMSSDEYKTAIKIVQSLHSNK